MNTLLRYRGRAVTATDVAFIRQLIAATPSATRRALSQKLCAAWNWVQANGTLRDMVCRGLLLFGASSEKTRAVFETPPRATPLATSSDSAAATATPPAAVLPAPRKGHGRHGAED